MDWRSKFLKESLEASNSIQYDVCHFVFTCCVNFYTWYPFSNFDYTSDDILITTISKNLYSNMKYKVECRNSNLSNVLKSLTFEKTPIPKYIRYNYQCVETLNLSWAFTLEYVV